MNESEKKFIKLFKKLYPGGRLIRFPDLSSGFTRSPSPADFVAITRQGIKFIEIKETKNSFFSYSDSMRDSQLKTITDILKITMNPEDYLIFIYQNVSKEWYRLNCLELTDSTRKIKRITFKNCEQFRVKE